MKRLLPSVSSFPLISLVALLPAFSVAHAQPQPATSEYDGPIFKRPTTPRPLLKHSSREFEADGQEVTENFPTSQYLTIGFTTPLTAWSRQNEPAVSASYYFRGDRKVTFSFSLFDFGEFIPDINRKSLKGYIEGLKILYKKRVEFLNDDGNYRPSGQRTWPLDRLNRLIIYTLSKPGSDTKNIHYEYFLVINKHVLIASLSGPEGSVEGAAKRNFESVFFTSYVVE